MQTIEDIVLRAHRKGFASEVIETADMMIKRGNKITDLVKIYEQAYYETQSRHQATAAEDQLRSNAEITTRTRLL